jgi:host factor-I protein
MTKHNINIQDGYLFQSLKEGQIMFLELVTGRHLLGRLKRFDRFAVVLESEGKEILIYKHAIATIALAPATQASGAPQAAAASPSTPSTPQTP